MNHSLKLLPLKKDFLTNEVLKYLSEASRNLGELKGYAKTIPNQQILINATMLQESKDSSAIENIVTTYDELYRAFTASAITSEATKEVISYRKALLTGYYSVKEKGFINTNLLISIQKEIEPTKPGIRKLPGTVLKNGLGEIIYTPPEAKELNEYLKNLDEYINNSDDGIDPLIKLAIIHYQFESIHPFYDGNGRTGRILNILYLILNNLIDIPILYLSNYIIKNKNDYYKLFDEIRNTDNYENWIIYFLKGINEVSKETIDIINKITDTMNGTKEEIQSKLPKIYSKELLETLYFEFYTKTSYVEKSLNISRKTATTYLKELERIGILSSEKIGKEVIYKNIALFNLIKEVDDNI